MLMKSVAASAMDSVTDKIKVGVILLSSVRTQSYLQADVLFLRVYGEIKAYLEETDLNVEREENHAL